MEHMLTPELEATIAAKVASGRYRTGNEVLAEAMQALDEREERDRKLAELRAEIQLGIDDIEAGRMTTLTVEKIQEMKARGRERLATANGESNHV